MTTVKCFEMGFSVLLDVDLWIKWGSVLANIATFFAMLVAIAGAIIAYCQYLSSKKESRSTSASNIYNQYLTLCLNKSHFAFGMTKPNTRTSLYGEYCWFVSSMLFAFEQILDAQPDDSKWRSTIKSQLSLHKDFLRRSRTVRDQEWTKSLQELIQDVI